MKVTLESTTRIVEVDGVNCRVWEGSTENGIAVQALIPRIAAGKNENLSQFEAELQEHRPPSAAVSAFSLRMVL